MPSAAGIKRRDADQSVDAHFGTQVAIGVTALKHDRDALDPCLIAGQKIKGLGLEAAAIGPAQIHSQQNADPILGLGPACSGMDCQHGIVSVMLA